jgi:hypothetical protein
VTDFTISVMALVPVEITGDSAKSQCVYESTRRVDSVTASKKCTGQTMSA